ncbi:MAG: YlmC/YmxH family sporulation protein [Clostridia bacterium]|nr:YlmC/YmxH family sporulation protein [Clostridia bacterium]
MNCRIAELRNKQVVCTKNGCVLGFISDVEINTSDGKIEAIVILGKLRFFGLLGREDDIVIPWQEIDVIGRETVLVTTDPTPFVRLTKGI